MNIRKFLQSAHHMTISVVTESGDPWAVPVGIKSYKKGVFSWVSMADTVHSQAIEHNQKVAVTIFTTKPSEYGDFGFYALASAQKSQWLPGGAGIYRAVIEEAWYNDENRKKIMIPLEDL